MNKQDQLTALANKYGEVSTCACGGFMVSRKEVHKTRYKGVILKLKNFPYMRCLDQNCDFAMFRPSDSIKYLPLARLQYDRYGKLVYHC